MLPDVSVTNAFISPKVSVTKKISPNVRIPGEEVIEPKFSSADSPREGIPNPHNFNRRQRGTRYDSPKSIVSESESEVK